MPASTGLKSGCRGLGLGRTQVNFKPIPQCHRAAIRQQSVQPKVGLCRAAYMSRDCLAIAKTSGLTPKHECPLQVLNKRVTMCSSLVDRAQHLLDPGSPDAMRLVWTLLVLYCTMAVPALAWTVFALRKLLKRGPSAKASPSSPACSSGCQCIPVGCPSLASST